MICHNSATPRRQKRVSKSCLWPAQCAGRTTGRTVSGFESCESWWRRPQWVAQVWHSVHHTMQVEESE